MRIRCQSLLLAAVLTLVQSPAARATMEFVSDDRNLFNFEEACDATFGDCSASITQTAVPDPLFSDFDVTLTGYERRVAQTSTLSPTQITGSGIAADDAGGSPPPGFFVLNQSSRSVFSVTFDLDTPMQIDLTGILSVTGSTFDTGVGSYSLVSATLGTIASQTLRAEEVGDTSVPVVLNILLDPGTYTLGFSGSAVFAGSGSFDFTLNASEVPGPSTPVPALRPTGALAVASLLLVAGALLPRGRLRLPS